MHNTYVVPGFQLHDLNELLFLFHTYSIFFLYFFTLLFHSFKRPSVRLSVFLSHIKSVRAFSSTNLNECEWVDVLNCVVFLWHFFTIQDFLLFILMQNYFKKTIVCWLEFSYLFLHLEFWTRSELTVLCK